MESLKVLKINKYVLAGYVWSQQRVHRLQNCDLQLVTLINKHIKRIYKIAVSILTYIHKVPFL